MIYHLKEMCNIATICEFRYFCDFLCSSLHVSSTPYISSNGRWRTQGRLFFWPEVWMKYESLIQNIVIGTHFIFREWLDWWFAIYHKLFFKASTNFFFQKVRLLGGLCKYFYWFVFGIFSEKLGGIPLWKLRLNFAQRGWLFLHFCTNVHRVTLYQRHSCHYISKDITKRHL